MTRATELKALHKEFGALLDSHGGRKLSEFKKYENDPVGFIKDVLKANLWSRQEELAEDLADARNQPGESVSVSEVDTQFASREHGVGIQRHSLHAGDRAGQRNEADRRRIERHHAAEASL